MIQDRTANQMSRESGLTVEFDRGHTRKRGYWIVNGAFLGLDAPAARKTLASVKALADEAAATDWEVNQYENGAEYVRAGHTIEEAAREFDVCPAALVRFIEANKQD
jgi:hypothetical protein